MNSIGHALTRRRFLQLSAAASLATVTAPRAARAAPDAGPFKTDIHSAGGGKREADLGRFTQLLRDGGYQGWVALEYEAEEDPLVAVPRYLRQMQELFAG